MLDSGRERESVRRLTRKDRHLECLFVPTGQYMLAAARVSHTIWYAARSPRSPFPMGSKGCRGFFSKGRDVEPLMSLHMMPQYFSMSAGPRKKSW